MVRYIRTDTKEEANQIVERENKKQARENWFVNVSVKESRKGGYTVKIGKTELVVSCIEILIIFVQLANCIFRGMGVYYNQKLKWIDKRRKICYNNKRKARNRLALVCVFRPRRDRLQWIEVLQCKVRQFNALKSNLPHFIGLK